MNDQNINNNDTLNLSETEKKHLLNLRSNPHFAQQMYAMTDEFRREVDSGMDANETETMLIESLQKLGNSMMHQWAETTQQTQVQKLKKEQKLHLHSKKEIQWNTTFGTIEIMQQILRVPPKGKRIHPFRDYAKISHRCCSQNLTRRIVDFSAERSFQKTAEAIKEHYNIEISIHAIDHATDVVSKQAKQFNSSSPGSIKDADLLISEVDGSMIPVVEIDANEQGDKRKTRKCVWKEIRVSTVREPNEISCYYGVGVGEPFSIGCMMYQCCQFKGLTPATHIHAVSDGAKWIADQYEQHFGDQHTFTLDYYHACDY